MLEVVLIFVSCLVLASLVVEVLLSYSLLYQARMVWDLTIHWSVKLYHLVPGLVLSRPHRRRQVSILAGAGFQIRTSGWSFVQMDHDLLATLLISY